MLTSTELRCSVPVSAAWDGALSALGVFPADAVIATAKLYCARMVS